MSNEEAVAGLNTFSLGEYDDQRLPIINEFYSLIQFNGLDPSLEGNDPSMPVPFIDTDYFIFEYGDESVGESIVDF